MSFDLRYENLLAASRNLYLDLLASALMGTLYKDPPQDPWNGVMVPTKEEGVLELVAGPYNAEAREYGRDWPATAHTMIGRQRLLNLRHLIETIIEERVPGDLIEAGVWRGGACIFMRGVLKAWGVARQVIVADSFEGLPKPTFAQDKDDKHHIAAPLAVSLEQVQENFDAYGLLDQHVEFLKGWFSQTLPTLVQRKFALVRLDGDMYESTMDGLRFLYPLLTSGGYLIVDDYNAVKACHEAVDDYRRIYEIAEPMVSIDGLGIYWRKA